METAVSDSYLDNTSLNKLKNQSNMNSKEALKAVASEFESIFMKMMLKSMRDASFGDPLFNSESAKFYRDMHDDQLTLNLSKQGGVGIADMMVKQLEQYLPKSNSAGHNLMPKKNDGIADPKSEGVISSPHDFVKSLWPLAENASEKTGISPKVLIAQSALETGWGKYVVRDKQGKNSFNLFNIKADGRWDGKKAAISTVEYTAGKAQQKEANFRVYGSFEESFNDYVNFLQQSPRYKEALQHASDDKSFLNSLQKSGYATDPNYAKKIDRIMNDRPLNDALSKLSLQVNSVEQQSSVFGDDL